MYDRVFESEIFRSNYYLIISRGHYLVVVVLNLNTSAFRRDDSRSDRDVKFSS